MIRARRGVHLPGVSVAPPDDSASELEDELLNVSALPAIVSPLVEPVEALPVAMSAYLEPPVPVQPDTFPSVTSRVSPLRVAVDCPILDVFPSYLISPALSVYDPVTSQITPFLQEDADFLLPASLATMDQYLLVEGDLLLGDMADVPLLSLSLLPLPVTDDSVPGSFVVSPAGEPVVVPSDVMPDLSREGPFDVHQDALESGATPQTLESLPGCQYRMTSYDDADRSDMDPAYGLHLHDPRLLEYVGAPAQPSAGLLVASYGPGSGYLGCPSVAARRWTHHVKPAGSRTIRDVTEHDVVRGYAVGVCP